MPHEYNTLQNNQNEKISKKQVNNINSKENQSFETNDCTVWWPPHNSNFNKKKNIQSCTKEGHTFKIVISYSDVSFVE